QDLRRLESHQKVYPGFDIASINRALDSFCAECVSSRNVGAFGFPDVRQFLDQCKCNAFFRMQKPSPPIYQRVPVDVEEEQSVVVTALYLAKMRLEAKDGTETVEPIAIVLQSQALRGEAWEDLDTRQTPQQHVTISVSCRSRAAADVVFREIESRRQR